MKPLEVVLFENILRLEGINGNIVGLYPFGSITYGTQTENSDYDFVVIVDTDDIEYYQYETDDIDIHVMSIDTYETRLKDHDIMALEVYFNPMPIIKFETDFVLDKIKLRHNISSIVSNSWVKAKKKVLLENEDNWIGYKSLFHSMRILDFGLQMARNGKISYFNCMSFVWDEIREKVDNNETIGDIMKYYKPMHNKKLTKFRELAPKG